MADIEHTVIFRLIKDHDKRLKAIEIRIKRENEINAKMAADISPEDRAAAEAYMKKLGL